jgi:hypothetical protein
LPGPASVSHGQPSSLGSNIRCRAPSSSFNRPIHINEFNCGEIYSGSAIYPGDPNYENQAGQPVTEACLKGLAKHLLEIATQTVANVESVHFCEALDEVGKPVLENRFGLV